MDIFSVSSVLLSAGTRKCSLCESYKHSSPGFLLFFNGTLLIYLELKIKDITQSEITNLVTKCPGINQYTR